MKDEMSTLSETFVCTAFVDYTAQKWFSHDNNKNKSQHLISCLFVSLLSHNVTGPLPYIRMNFLAEMNKRS